MLIIEKPILHLKACPVYSMAQMPCQGRFPSQCFSAPLSVTPTWAIEIRTGNGQETRTALLTAINVLTACSWMWLLV